jgi:hypothetical protein
MNDENANEKIFRKLKYFLDNNIPVHLTELDGTFHNGFLKELVVAEKLVVIKDRISGIDIIPVEDINENSIAPFKEGGR